ncbi:MAG: hypothetical protein KY391_01015 [Actinobacteria bacterium]|nr:hypothetical protein [Actinomycetota bacterium]
MIPLLILVHAGIGLLAVVSSAVETPQRGRVMEGLAVTGGGAGLLLFFASPFVDDSWRTLDLNPSGTRIAGIAVAAAWIVVAVAERSRGGGRWEIVATTGVASTALCMFALNDWAIPALLFAAIASLAVSMSGVRQGTASGAISVAIAFVASSIIWETIETQQWELATPVSGARLWLAVAGAVAFSVAAVVSESSDRPAPLTPLALGLAFATLGSIARAAGPIVALPILAVALIAVIRTLTKETVAQRVVMVWAVALTVGLAALSGNLYVTTRSAIAGILAATAVRLWPLSLGRAQIERGILVAFVAVTAGFNAIAAAATYSFDRSTAIERVFDAAPWAAVSALLPVVLAGGVVLGATVGRNPEPEDYTRSGVLGSWSLVILSVAIGVVPYVGDARSGLAGPMLYVVAVVAGAAAARYASALGAATDVPATDSRFVDVPLRSVWPRPMALGAGALGAITAIGTLAATYHGLRLGFL